MSLWNFSKVVYNRYASVPVGLVPIESDDTQSDWVSTPIGLGPGQNEQTRFSESIGTNSTSTGAYLVKTAIK